MDNWRSPLESLEMTKSFWSGKRVFITGHTGFKGAWLSLWLQKMGAELCGFSLAPPTNPSLFDVAKVGLHMNSIIGDIRNLDSLSRSMKEFDPEIVFHLAAQPLVRYSYENPVETYSTNVMGTVNVLEAVRKCNSVQAIVVVTSDKCYENKEWPWGYRENESMGGHDPYSSSKGCAELVTSAYRRSFFYESGNNTKNSVGLASARAGNVIGGGDWAMDRLVPDIIQSLQKKEVLKIRNPDSIRPWQHVLEPLCGYLCLAEKLYNGGLEYSEGWNFGPLEENAKPVSWIVNTLFSQWGNTQGWENVSTKNQPHEAHFLKLDCSKAKMKLEWQAHWDLKLTLEKIVFWYKKFNAGENMHQVTINQIDEYSQTGAK
jgi:CDP-glucose 4,6-dehydratase